MVGNKPIEFDALPDTAYRNGIWWLASFPKSGSTWVRMFLNCAVSRFPPDINAAFQYAKGDLGATDYQNVSAIPLGCMGIREAIYFRPAMLLNQLALSPGRDVVLKTHHANIYVDEIPMCPAKLSKGALYIARDPRDIAPSFAKHMGVGIDKAIAYMASPKLCLHRTGSPLFHYVADWSGHVRSWLSPDNPISTSCVKYEDLLAKPAETFRLVCDALGLHTLVDDDAIAFAIRETEFSRLKAQEQEHGFKETGDKQSTFFNTGRAGVWREILTEKQARRIEQDHGEVMRELGYLQGA